MRNAGIFRTTSAFVLLCLEAGTPRNAPSQASEVRPASAGSAFTIEILDSMERLPGGLAALPPPPGPARNPQTTAKIELGRMLFHDTSFSRDRSLSCASCHDPRKGYSDGGPRAVGIGQSSLPRRSPSLLNAAYNSSQFWDGRVRSLEEQAAAPVLTA